MTPEGYNTNEEIAASMAEPFSSSELIPNSSFTKNWCAEFLSFMSSIAICAACSAGIPFAL